MSSMSVLWHKCAVQGAFLGDISEGRCYLKWNSNANIPPRGTSIWGMDKCLSCWSRSVWQDPGAALQGWTQCPQPVAHAVAAPPRGQSAPLCGLGELSGSGTACASRNNLTILQLWGLCLRRGSHTINTKRKPSVCRAHSPGHSCNDSRGQKNYCLWAGWKDLIQKVPYLSGHSSPFWLKVAPSQWLEDKEVFC